MASRRFTHVVLRFAAIIVCFGLFGISPVSAGPDLPPLEASGTAGITGGLYKEEVLISPINNPDADRYRPAIAYNPDKGQYLVVWHNQWPNGHRDIYAQRVKDTGELIGPWFSISAGDNDRLQPAVAYNGTDGYLVVFMYDELGDGKKYNIKGQRVRWDGVLQGDAFDIEKNTNRSYWSPRVAWNEYWEEYWVVWGTMTQDTQTPIEIGFEIYDSACELEYGTILTNIGTPANPDLAYDPISHNTLVVWNRLNASEKNTVIGDLRDAAGNRLLADVFLVYGETSIHALFPRVAATNSSTLDFLRFVVVYDYAYSSTDHDIYMAWVNPTSGLFGDGHYVVNTSLENDTYPAIAGSTKRLEYLFVYQRASTSGAKILAQRYNISDPFDAIEVCSFDSWDCTMPAVRFGNAGYLTAYQGDSTANPLIKQHIYGRMYSPEAVFLPLVRR